MKKIPRSILLLVYTKEKDVLLLKKKGHDDMWQSITGSLLQNEKPIDAAVRELHDETGISSSDIIDCNKYYVFEILKTEKIQKKINDVNIKENILENLKINSKRKYITEIIYKINNNNFNKLEFDNLLKEENATSKKVSIESLNDDKQLSENLVQQIYTYPEKKVILVADMGLSEVYLVYIDKVENVTISRESEDYKKYLKLSQAKMITDLYAAYDMFLRKKYEVEINYSALDNLKNNIK